MTVTSYNRDKAVAYAHKWAFSRNPAYYNFNKIGGDCTNFTSQCILNGDAAMNYTPVYGWYYNNTNSRSPSWAGVDYLYAFMVSNQGQGPFAQDVAMEKIQPGDFVQLKLNKTYFQHTPFVVETGTPPTLDNILISAHSLDSDNRPLGSYKFSDIRFIHVLGIRHT